MVVACSGGNFASWLVHVRTSALRVQASTRVLEYMGRTDSVALALSFNNPEMHVLSSSQQLPYEQLRHRVARCNGAPQYSRTNPSRRRVTHCLEPLLACLVCQRAQEVAA